MVYRVIGLMSGSSLDGLDIVYTHLQESSGKWKFEIIKTACYPYNAAWKQQLQSATSLPALDYNLLHTSYGNYLGEQVNHFINENNLHYQVQLIASHGHTTFHVPEKKMTAQLGDGAAIAAITNINVVSDLRAMDIALGGQGAPIVPIGEKLLFSEYDFFLNIGGIANISCKINDQFIGFDICPANRILNLLANEVNKEFDLNGELAAQGNINNELLEKLNGLPYYGHAYPKSLANNFGTEIVYPLIKNSGNNINDALRTYVEHICLQTEKAISNFQFAVFNNDDNINKKTGQLSIVNHQLLITGGGALNTFLIEELKKKLQKNNINIIVPDENIIQYKEALIMALIGVLRWREENNVLASVTGANRNSIGGAVWIGQQA
jgi:anhydro-N-acetylmuramic acid kinase